MLVACAASPKLDARAVLTASPTPIERDVPVPTGFLLVDRASEDWSNESARYLRHEYRGRADKRAVREFYRRQMPLVRWTLLDDSNVHGSIVMRFQRGTESCRVQIEDRLRGWSRSTVIQVLIAPNKH